MATLVTGAAGFIGYHVARSLLDRGEQVIGIDSFVPYYRLDLKESRLAALQHPDFTFHRVDFAHMADLASALAPHPISRIVHLGAQPGVRWSIDHPHDYAHSNLAGQLNLLELARRLQVPMVYASSSSVYGANTKLPFAVEDRVDHPISLYAATKKSAELMAETYAHLYRIPLTGLRFFTVYGPWGRPDMAVWKFTEACLKGEKVALFNAGNMRRDFTYIGDIVSGILACADTPPADDGRVKPGGSVAPHALFNIGNHRSEPLMRLVQVIESACGKPLHLDDQPMQPGDVPDTYADISAIAETHGFAPTTPIDTGVPRFVDWYRKWTAN
ncbi:NAD-dependent epimerase/dehydratase family protein [Sandaracinobacteroides hominis]|uniref:NAD-dependent epimerase/dehydratase family protein n=1 Tax=Sandaracinobacteroides hominis TaxID=2780086 RepID=UPI0018F28F39|nr:NAD-dependent epimerase/dehydratase family protein [Sandaracinobacteroides hominis]